MKREIIALGIVRHEDRYLIAQRSDNNAWEFVSSNVNVTEIAEEAILQRLAQEFGLFGTIKHQGQPYTLIQDDTQWTIMPYIINSATELFSIYSNKHSDLKWVTKEELRDYTDLFVVEVPNAKKSSILT